MTSLILSILLSAVAADCQTSVYFDTAKANISAQGKADLDRIAACSQDALVVQVDVVGKADVRPYKEGNLFLSTLRALSVKDYLVAKGVNESIIEVSQVGDTQPVCGTRDADCLARNRRADVKVIKTAPVCSAPEVVIIPPKVIVVEKTIEVEKPSPWEIMVFGEFGVHKNTGGYDDPTQITQKNLRGKFNNWGVWQFGTEFHYLPFRLGLRTQAGNNGFGAVAQVFPVQGAAGGKLNWYIGPGVAYTSNPFYRPTVPEVQRYWDLQLWTGVEYEAIPHLVILADVRADLPLPWSNSYTLTSKNVTDALKQTALLVGVGYRF